jgi:hypothetical protein
VLLVEVRRKVGWEDGWGCSEHMGEEGGERKEVEESRRAELCDMVLWGMRGEKRETEAAVCTSKIQVISAASPPSPLERTAWGGANAAELELCV